MVHPHWGALKLVHLSQFFTYAPVTFVPAVPHIISSLPTCSSFSFLQKSHFFRFLLDCLNPLIAPH